MRVIPVNNQNPKQNPAFKQGFLQLAANIKVPVDDVDMFFQIGKRTALYLKKGALPEGQELQFCLTGKNRNISDAIWGARFCPDSETKVSDLTQFSPIPMSQTVQTARAGSGIPIFK